MRYAARIDANKREIVEALRGDKWLTAAGLVVYDVKQPVDLMLGGNGVTMLMEIKDGNKVPSARKHTKNQRKFLETWTGGPVATVTDVEGALTAARLLFFRQSAEGVPE